MRPIQIMLPFGVFLIKSKANTQLFEEKLLYVVYFIISWKSPLSAILAHI